MSDQLCEVCYCVMIEGEDLEDGVSLTADCCGREGLCKECREPGEHDCDEHQSQGT